MFSIEKACFRVSLSAILAANLASAAIITGTGTVVLVEGLGQNSQTWGIDGQSMTVELTLDGDSATQGSEGGVIESEATAQVMVEDPSGNLGIAVNPDSTIQIFSSGSVISGAAGLTFSSSLFGQDLAAGSSMVLAEAEDQAFTAAGIGAMAEVVAGESGNGIMGFRYLSGSDYRYGWANVVWDSSYESFFFGVDSVTASTGQGILAGTTSEIPEPAAIGSVVSALAFGVAAFMRRRPSRSME